MFDQTGIANLEVEGQGALPLEPNMTGEKMIKRDPPGDEVPRSRRHLAQQWVKKITADKAHWEKAFKRMRDDARFARDPVNSEQWGPQGRYVANVIQRHIKQRVDSLYAKNPRIPARRRPRLDFAIWDGSGQSLQMAGQASAAVGAGVMMPPEQMMQAQAVLQDASQGLTRKQQNDRLAKTAELLFELQLANQPYPFKAKMKRLVRRVVTTGVGWLKLCIRREMGKRPETVNEIATIEQRVLELERILADQQDGELQGDAAELEAARILLQSLQQEQEIVTFEGLVFEYPRATAIIPDRHCSELEGFVGARHVTEEHMMTVDEVKKIFGIDLKMAAGTNSSGSSPLSKMAYRNGRPVTNYDGDGTDCEVCVWETYCATTGLVYFTVDGYDDFLKEPAAPDYRLERFYPWFLLSFNPVEDEEDIWPLSDVTLLRPMQLEYNRARDGLKVHRIANKPKYAVSGAAGLTDSDRAALQTGAEHAIITFDGLGKEQSINDIIQPIKGAPIDPALYDTSPLFEDILRVGGAQEANLGGTSSATATESSIAEGSRMASVQSNVDDLEEFLSDVATEATKLMLMEFGAEYVTKLCGPGSYWPDIPNEEILSEIFLEVEAGSSGRPNRQLEIENFARLAPILQTIPGITAEWLAKEGVRRMDDRADLSQAIAEGMASIAAQNQMARAAQAAPAAGAQGASAGGDGGEAAPPQQPGSPPGGQGQTPGQMATPPAALEANMPMGADVLAN